MRIELATAGTPDGDSPKLFGFAFIDSWNIDVVPETSADRALLGVMDYGIRRRRGAIRVQHRVKLALQLMCPMSIDPVAATPASLSSIWQQCLSCAMRVSGPGIPSRITFEAGRDRTIVAAIEEHGTVLHLWPLPHLVAVSICVGVCGSDFSVVFERETHSSRWLPPHLPADLKSIALPSIATPIMLSIPTPIRNVSDLQRKHGFLEAFPIEAKIADTEVTVDLKSTSLDMDDHMSKIDRLSIALGNDSGTASLVKKNMRKTIRRQNFQRLDVGAMLAHRELYAETGPFFRFIATDKGPQQKGSWELLNTVEVRVPRSAVMGKALLDIDKHLLRKHKLAPCCMSQSGTDLPNTVCSLLHQCWLDYGPTAAQLRASNHDVIGLGTDLGCEAGICDHHDVTDFYIDAVQTLAAERKPCQSVDSCELSEAGFLFPMALKVAGPLHCIDWIIRASLNKLTGFIEYLNTAKTILQYMHSKTHRVFLKMRLVAMGLPPEVVQQCTKDLFNGCGRFADWRWRSLDQCVRDLLRYELSICSLCGDNRMREHLSRNAKVASAFELVTESGEFWYMNKLMAHLLQPLMRLHGWIQGCPCHPVNGPDDSRPANCPFQGLNCAGFSRKLGETIEWYENIRSNGSLEEFGNIDVLEIQDIIGFIIAMLVLKLKGWVDDLPYLIWQVVIFN